MRFLATWVSISLAFGLTAASQATLYVSKQGSDLNSGADWAHAKASIQEAIDASSPGDQIWVGKGTYTETVTLSNNRKLFGSFAGTETDPSQRNMVANPSMLVQDGDESMFVPSVCSPTTRVDGLVFNSAGTASAPLEYPDIECWGSPVFTNCLVTGAQHSYEALIVIPNGSPQFQACTFSGNNIPVFPTATEASFLMEIWASASFYQCKFANNTSRGFYVRGSASFTSCSITGNNGGVYGDGAKSVIFLSCVCTSNQNLSQGVSLSLTAKNCIFQGNSSCVTGASMDVENCQFNGNQGCIGAVQEPFALFLSDCLFSNNSTDLDATSNVASRQAKVHRCVFVNNGSRTAEATLVVGSGTVENCLFANNLSVGGTALGIEGNTIVANCTFSGNTVPNTTNSDGVVAAGNTTVDGTKVTVANCILLGNAGGGIYVGTNVTATLDHNDLIGNAHLEYSGVSPGPTDISVDPQFFNPGYGDCHLSPGSPCIGTGNPAYFTAKDIDLDGISRLTGGKISMGTYEPFPMSISALSISTPIVGGFNAVANVTLSSTAYYGLVVAFIESGVSGAQSMPFPTGATTGKFDIPTQSVTASTNVTVTVVYGSSSKSATLTVTPPNIISVVMPNAGVVGGNSGTGTLNFNGPISTSASVSLASSSPYVTVPASVPGSGAASQPFTFSTAGVGGPQSVTVTATYNGVQVHSSVMVLAASLKYLLASGKTVKGGGRLAGYLYLDGSAPAGGAVVSLTSNNPSLSVPATFTIPAGKNTASFLIQASTVTKTTMVTLTGSYKGAQVTVTIEVDP